MPFDGMMDNCDDPECKTCAPLSGNPEVSPHSTQPDSPVLLTRPKSLSEDDSVFQSRKEWIDYARALECQLSEVLSRAEKAERERDEWKKQHDIVTNQMGVDFLDAIELARSLNNTEKVLCHITKRLRDEYGIEINDAWVAAVLSGEHDKPLPPSVLARIQQLESSDYHCNPNVKMAPGLPYFDAVHDVEINTISCSSKAKPNRYVIQYSTYWKGWIVHDRENGKIIAYGRSFKQVVDQMQL